MPLHRRDFMKLLGVSLASLYLTRCQTRTAEPTEAPYDQPTCYEPPPPTSLPTPVPTSTISSARQRLRLYWLRFGELAEKSRNDTENKLGSELLTGHRAVLDELVSSGEIPAPVADLVQEAYSAAVFHVWLSSVPMTCYIAIPPYQVESANILTEQAAVLNQIAAQGTVDPATLAKAQSALEHDLAFYALTEEEVQDLYKQLLENSEAHKPAPSFEELTLELTPEVKEATQFIIDLMTTK